MRTRAAGAAVAIGLALVTLVACGDDGGGTSSDDTTAITGSTSTTEAATTDPTTNFAPVSPGAGADGDVLRDGRHFGYITTLATNDDQIIGSFDLAEIFYGDEAVAAAKRDGTDYTENDGDFYISNINPKVRPITVASDARVLDVRYGSDACCDPVESTIARFMADRDAADEDRTAVNLTVKDGVVTEIQEIYFA